MNHSLVTTTPPAVFSKSAFHSLPLPERGGLWLRLSKHPLLMPYNRLAFLVVLINAMGFQYLSSAVASPGSIDIQTVGNLTLANFAIAILIRQQYVINFLFKIATSAPLNWPLKIRWALGKIYHFGGIHVGTFFSGTCWFAYFVWQSLQTEVSVTKPVLGPLALVHLLLLITMCFVALPKVRSRSHDLFEVIARFGTWVSLILFWIQSFFFIQPEEAYASRVSAFLEAPQAWVLLVATFSVALPWLRLRKVPLKIERPSSHVILADFNYGITPFAGSSTELSRSPLMEWHSFANVPIPNRTGFKLTISRAGDWTGKLIDDCPSHVWVKGIPTAGVGNVEKLFKKVVWVATGSGIGPCLPHLLAKQVPSTLVWSTRNPIKTYGDALVLEIKAAQPDAVIWDTDTNGKPNLAELAYRAYEESGAEAVICIANKKVTWNVVYEMESRGIPAFGAIWDS